MSKEKSRRKNELGKRTGRRVKEREGVEEKNEMVLSRRRKWKRIRRGREE